MKKMLTWYFHIQKKQHDSINVHRLSQKLSSFSGVDHTLQGLLNEVSVLQVADKLVEVCDVLEYTLEHQVELLDYHLMVLLELFVQVDQFDVARELSLHAFCETEITSNK